MTDAAPQQTASVVIERLREKDIKAIALVDDAYDPLGVGDVTDSDIQVFWSALQNKRSPDYQRMQEEFTGFIQAHLHKEITGLAEIDQDTLARLWESRDSFDALKDLILQLFYTKVTKISQLARIRSLLENQCTVDGKSIVEIRTIGSREDVVPQLEGAPIVFIDYFMGPGDDQDAQQRSTKRAKDITAGIYDQFASTRLPLVILMSSSPSVKLHQEQFRSDTGWLNGLFYCVTKEDLEDAAKIGISLGTWIERLEEGTKIQQFVNAIQSSLKSAGSEFRKSVRSLSLEDYAYVQSFSLQQDGQPLGEYMLWLFNSYLGRLVFEKNEEVNERRKVIDPISFDRLPLNQLMPSGDLIEMYDSALFNKRIGDISKHPALIEAAVDGICDLVEEKCSPLPYLRIGLIFTNSESHTVLMVLNADCDLAHTPNQKRQPINFVTLIEGELGEIKDWASPVREPKPKTDFFKLGEKAFHIAWKVNKVVFCEYAKVLHTLAEQGYQPYAHLRLPYALEVQRAYAAHFTRVGLPVSPPIWHEIGVEILFRDDEGKPRTLIGPQSELAFLMTVRDPAASEGGKQLQCRFTTQFGHSLKNAIARLTNIQRETLTGTGEGEAEKNRRTQLDSKIKRLEESYAEFDSLFLGNPSPVLSGMKKPVPIFKGKNLVGIWRNMDKEQFDSWGNYYLLVSLIDADERTAFGDTEGAQHDE